MGIEEYLATLLISVIGIGSIIGRIGLGYISDHPCINRLHVQGMCLGVCGISMSVKIQYMKAVLIVLNFSM